MTNTIKHTKGSWLFVTIEAPSKEVVNEYYETTGEMPSKSGSANSPREFKKATIEHTFNQLEYPKGSVWMMGESPGMKINYFGQKIIAIQEKDIYARVSD